LRTRVSLCSRFSKRARIVQPPRENLLRTLSNWRMPAVR
jgi:hypothetical protein